MNMQIVNMLKSSTRFGIFGHPVVQFYKRDVRFSCTLYERGCYEWIETAIKCDGEWVDSRDILPEYAPAMLHWLKEQMGGPLGGVHNLEAWKVEQIVEILIEEGWEIVM